MARFDGFTNAVDQWWRRLVGGFSIAGAVPTEAGPQGSPEPATGALPTNILRVRCIDDLMDR